MHSYSEQFYQAQHSRTAYATETVMSQALELFPGISSAVDVGCGVGTWLSVIIEKGVENILGMDGEWVTLLGLNAFSFA